MCIFPQMHAFPGFESFVSTLRESKRHRSTCYAGEPQQTDNEQPWHTKQLMMSIIIVIYVTYIILLTSCSWLFRRLFAFLQVLWRLVLGALSNLNLNWFVAACWAPTYCDLEKYNLHKLKVVALFLCFVWAGCGCGCGCGCCCCCCCCCCCFCCCCRCCCGILLFSFALHLLCSESPLRLVESAV